MTAFELRRHLAAGHDVRMVGADLLVGLVLPHLALAYERGPAGASDFRVP